MKGAALVAACTTLLAVAACSSGGGAAPTTAATTPTTTRLTEITGPIPVPSVTVPVVTQPVPGVSTPPPPGATTATTGAGPSTTAAPAPDETPCDAPTLFAVAKAATELPADTGAEQPLCALPWASMVVGAPNQDRALGVFVRNPGGAWRLVNLGTDQVCSGAGVPPELYAALGCAEWETE